MTQHRPPTGELVGVGVQPGDHSVEFGGTEAHRADQVPLGLPIRDEPGHERGPVPHPLPARARSPETGYFDAIDPRQHLAGPGKRRMAFGGGESSPIGESLTLGDRQHHHR
jgi:hypothetical protein